MGPNYVDSGKMREIGRQSQPHCSLHRGEKRTRGANTRCTANKPDRTLTVAGCSSKVDDEPSNNKNNDEHQLDARKHKLALAEPPDAKQIDGNHKQADKGQVDWEMIGVRVPERQDNLRCGDLDGDGY